MNLRRFKGLLDGPGDGCILTSILGLTSFVELKKMTTNGTGKCVVVGFLVTFLTIGTAGFFSADVKGIDLR